MTIVESAFPRLASAAGKRALSAATLAQWNSFETQSCRSRQFQVHPGNPRLHPCSIECDTENMTSSVAELDRSNVVDIDLGSAEFKANAHRHMAEWARRPPFYVLGKGPPQVVVGRTPTSTGVSDTETFKSEMPRGPGWEQFNKIMFAQFVTQMDGDQHARVRRLLMPAFSSRRIEQLEQASPGSSTACSTASRQTAPSSTACGLRGASRRRCLAGRHGEYGRPPQGDLRRVP